MFLRILSIRYQQQDFSSLIHFKTSTINLLQCKVCICVDLLHIYVDLPYCDVVSEM